MKGTHGITLSSVNMRLVYRQELLLLLRKLIPLWREQEEEELEDYLTKCA